MSSPTFLGDCAKKGGGERGGEGGGGGVRAGRARGTKKVGGERQGWACAGAAVQQLLRQSRGKATHQTHRAHLGSKRRRSTYFTTHAAQRDGLDLAGDGGGLRAADREGAGQRRGRACGGGRAGGGRGVSQGRQGRARGDSEGARAGLPPLDAPPHTRAQLPRCAGAGNGCAREGAQGAREWVREEMRSTHLGHCYRVKN